MTDGQTDRQTDGQTDGQDDCYRAPPTSSGGALQIRRFYIKYLASSCQFFYRYFYGRLPVEHF